MNSEFEEKDYEAPLYGELRFGSHRIATPGQVFEGKFGIDAAIEALNPLFWDMFGYYDIPEGVILDDLRWGFVWKRLGKKRKLPNFSTNLLVQAKRPQVLKRSRADLSRYGVTAKYWRFEITPHQQLLLERLSHKIRTRALVVYASAAFDTLDDLYDFTEKQEVVDNSSFVKVEKMTNHSKWNYNRPGTFGVATSEPEFIEDMPFSEMIQLYRKEKNIRDENNSKILSELHNAAVSICHELRENNPIAKHYLRINGRLERISEIFEHKESLDFIGFSLFCNIAKLKWLVI